MRGTILRRLGIIHYEQGDYAAAYTYIRQSLALFEEMGDKLRGSGAFIWLARLAMAQGNDGEARELLTRALMLTRQTGHLLNQIDPLDALARLAQRQGDYAQAYALLQESLAFCIAVDHPARMARTLESFACLAARQGQAEVAARLFGVVEPSFDFATTWVQFDPVWRHEHDQLVATARTQLGEAAFAAAWAVGEALTLEEAAALVKT
jgi:tetratricopeptide (TPR) repeat protein